MANPANFVSRHRATVAKLLETLDELAALDAEYSALGYEQALPPEAFAGANADLDATQVRAGMAAARTIRTRIEQAALAAALYRMKH